MPIDKMARKRKANKAAIHKKAEEEKGMPRALVIAAALTLILALALLLLSSGPQAIPGPQQPMQAQESPGKDNGILALEKPARIIDAKIRDGGYSFIITRDPKTTNVSGVAIDGVQKDYGLAASNGSDGGETLQIDEPDITCQNFGNGSVVVLVNYTVNGTTYTEEVAVQFNGCENQSSGSPPPVQCALINESCIEQNCCAGLDCGGDRKCHGYPGCAYIGDSCYSLECCEGLVCDNQAKVCQSAEGCAEAGQTCMDDGWCCSGLRCDYRLHECKSVPSCSPVEQPCATYDDCCPTNPPLVCRDLTCRYCSAKGGVCTQDSDCCMHTPPMACIDKACEVQSCVASGGACEEDLDCCGASCYFNVCRQA